jgi:hypothetical protein
MLFILSQRNPEPDDQEKNGIAAAPEKNPSACYNPIRT